MQMRSPEFDFQSFLAGWFRRRSCCIQTLVLPLTGSATACTQRFKRPLSHPRQSSWYDVPVVYRRTL